MERVLTVYQQPYDPRHPVLNMDEMPKQLISETRTPIPPAPGRPAREDHEYKREGTAIPARREMFTEPLGGWRQVALSERKTAMDWAHRVREVVDDPRYRDAERITLVCDNLNTHDRASFYEAFEPREAKRLADKLELVFTPKHGSWLNVAEIELSVLNRQCLHRRIAERKTMRREIEAWRDRRNEQQTGVDWRFTTDDARLKLKHLYPKIKT